jgi:hypothetical protein
MRNCSPSFRDRGLFEEAARASKEPWRFFASGLVVAFGHNKSWQRRTMFGGFAPSFPEPWKVMNALASR